MRRVVRRSLQVIALLTALIVGAAAMAAIVAQTTWFKEWLRAFIVRQAADYVNGRLSIGRLDGNLLFGVELEDIRITMDDQTVVEIHDVGLDYNILTFLAGHVVLDDIRVNQPVIRVQRTAEGWNITRLFRARTPDSPRRRLPIEIGELGVSDATVYVQEPAEERAVGTAGVMVPARIGRLDASVGVTSNEDALTIDLAHVSLRADEPYLGINALSGVIRRTGEGLTLDKVALRTEESSLSVDGVVTMPKEGTGRLDLHVSSDKFVVDEFARVVPALRGYVLQPAFEVDARGPIDALSVEFNAREAHLGEVSGALTADLEGPERRMTGTTSLVHVNVEPLIRARVRTAADLGSDVTGEARFDLVLPAAGRPFHGTYTLNAGQAAFAGYQARDVVARGRIDGTVLRVDGAASAYGGRGTATGTIAFGRPVTLSLTGRAAAIDLRNLPPVFRAPGVPSELQFAYTLNGRGHVYSADLQFDASALAAASIAPGTTAQVRFGAGRAPEYAARGQVANLDVQQVGHGFGIRAIAGDRYRSRVNATFDVTGSGGGRYPFTLDATGTLVDSELFGAMFPRLEMDAHFGGGDARVSAAGEFAQLDPAVITGNERIAGTVTGAMDLEATMRDYVAGVTIDSIEARGRVNLADSTVGGLDIDFAAIDGSYRDREGQLTTFEITGPDLTARAQGTIALTDAGASNLKAHIETPALESVGTMLKRPLRGAAVVDATVTGNARELTAEGALQGSNIGYGETTALTLSSTFAVSVPELTPDAATVRATSAATFVEIAGQSVNELTADTTYSQGTLDFSAVAQHGMREVAASGVAVLHPDHHEIHLGDFALRAEQVEWRSAPGAEAAIRYGEDRLAVEDLRLVSGDQRIQLDGGLGSPGDVLLVRAGNVDMAQLDTLLLGEQRFAGRLDAEAAVSGPLEAPRAEGSFALRQGAFRQFTFDSLAGRVDYVGRGVNVDVRLDRSPQASLTAKGYAPLSLFKRNPPGIEGHETPEAGEGIDLQMTSTRIDLGVVQGFTSYVRDVTGALQADVHVTGTGRDPHFEGVVDVRGGAFAIPELGTAYTGLDTRVDLKPDAVTIGEMRLLDEHRQVMTIGGTLAVHELAVGAVDVEIKSENFEVIDNDVATLKLDTDVRVTGELRAPRVEGFVEVESGAVDVAHLMEQATSDAYATEAVMLEEAAAAAGAALAATETPAPTMPHPRLLDALDLTLGVAVPGNLVLRGNDLRPANAPIDIGDMTVTVGGAMQIRKGPGERPRLVGEVNTIRGSYTFQGRRFEIMRDGRIRFAGTEEIDPLVDLRARRVISGVETFVRVQGTLRQPELSFSSRPPLDQADILSLIVFNVPINQLGEGQQVSLAEYAGALAGGYLVSGLTRSIAEALELDEFEIQAEESERGLTPTLSIGEQVGERLFFRIRQGFGAEEATEFILEYQIAEFLRLQGSVAETAGGTQRVTFRRIERGGLDLIFFFSY
ncbi:MAG: translocation/assembly module TamB domain-containing protein [Acidobacteria bacterium]|nr:translocation/assembly module TamB domain-containing protein [Acidobacteriota bacterium]